MSMRAIRQPIHMVLLGRTTNRCSMLACQLAGLLAQASGVSLFIVCYGAAIIGAATTPETTSTFTTGQCSRRAGRAIERLIPILEDRGLSRSSWLNWVETLARSLASSHCKINHRLLAAHVLLSGNAETLRELFILLDTNKNGFVSVGASVSHPMPCTIQSIPSLQLMAKSRCRVSLTSKHFWTSSWADQASREDSASTGSCRRSDPCARTSIRWRCSAPPTSPSPRTN